MHAQRALLEGSVSAPRVHFPVLSSRGRQPAAFTGARAMRRANCTLRSAPRVKRVAEPARRCEVLWRCGHQRKCNARTSEACSFMNSRAPPSTPCPAGEASAGCAGAGAAGDRPLSEWKGSSTLPCDCGCCAEVYMTRARYATNGGQPGASQRREHARPTSAHRSYIHAFVFCCSTFNVPS